MAEAVNALVSAALLDDRARRKKESNAAIAAAVDERTPFHVVKEAVRSAGGENQNDSLLQQRCKKSHPFSPHRTCTPAEGSRSRRGSPAAMEKSHQRRGDYV